MTDVQFEEPQYTSANTSTKQSFMTKLVMKTGLAKDDAGVQKVLIGVFIIVVILTILVLKIGLG